MIEDKKPTQARKIVDVSHPGQTAPSPNSKSVIISHHPTMKDPMVNADQSSAHEPEAPAPAKVSRTVIQPLPGSSLLTKPDPELPPNAVQQPASASDTPPDSDDQPAQTNVQPPAEPAPEQAEAKALVATSTGTTAQLGTKDVKSDAEIASAEDAEAKRQTELEAMIEDKRYNLPINTAENQRTQQFVVGGVVIGVILVAAWVNIALDAGIIHLGGVKALTHFFSN